MNPSWQSIAAVAAGGAVGATARYAVGLLAVRWHPEAAPLGTFAVNAAGCLLIGAAVTLVERSTLPPSLGLFLITGLLGGLTTFSTFAYETVLLAGPRGRFDLALLNLAANLGVGLLAAWSGRGLDHAGSPNNPAQATGGRQPPGPYRHRPRPTPPDAPREPPRRLALHRRLSEPAMPTGTAPPPGG